jgi:hypothetical protein
MATRAFITNALRQRGAHYTALFTSVKQEIYFNKNEFICLVAGTGFEPVTFGL